ncbi:hypothetical protein [Mycobacterium colombiense]|uniref:hypothetical protein n=1 Tax=Mycobacterium colombiense TaxID=339268 RepID=UPI00200A1DF7|nr:hypothetical protein [Mycobacterium colombiense]MCK8644718.1 hypothetical protein [Mycobacterium colombiense]
MDRQRLIDKYGHNNPPDPNNEIASAALAGQSLVAKMFNWRDKDPSAELFDPDRADTLHKLWANTYRKLRLAIGRREVDVVDGYDNTMDPNDDDTATFVHFVGTATVVAVRPEHHARFACVFRAEWVPKLSTGRAEYCRVRIVPACGGVGPLQYWPYQCGRFVLLFPVCNNCRDRAIEAIEDSQALIPHRMEALADETPDPPWTQYEPPPQDSGGGAGPA